MKLNSTSGKRPLIILSSLELMAHCKCHDPLRIGKAVVEIRIALLTKPQHFTRN